MEPDFSGFATKAGLECSDGRTIMPDAFKDMNGKKVPLVWQHNHSTPDNVLGHAVLEARPDGVYARGFFNKTPAGLAAKELVQHDDVSALSIWANKLVERSKKVFNGVIKEVSLVLSGANPGAFIDNVAVAHGDGEYTELDDEVIIFHNVPLDKIVHSDEPTEEAEADETDDVVHADGTLAEIIDSMTDVQKNALYFIAQKVAEQSTAQHSDDNMEGTGEMPRNVFENDKNTKQRDRIALSHSDIQGIMAEAKKPGQTLKSALEGYAEAHLAHGIEDIELLFPDATAIDSSPQFDKRRTEWVSAVLNGTRHSPMSRVKTLSANITHDEARARGYVKGNLKKAEFFKLTKRTTGPKTIYKKQQLDRDDIIDIVDLDVVAWLKAEMRLMLEEEIARAILIGDGREVDDEDKIDDPAGATSGDGIRSIYLDDQLFAAKTYVNLLDASSTPLEAVDKIVEQRKLFKGTGVPTLYTTEYYLTKLLLLRDTTGRRLYRTVQELADELRVSSIVTVEPMEDITDLFGIIVNLQDYTVGADKGGEVNMFDDFDIDYNLMKYLMETRISGGLTKIRSAVVIMLTASTDVHVVPNSPTFVSSTGVVTIVATTGVVYKNEDTGATLSTGAQTALAAGADVNIVAVPAAGYYFDNNVEERWYFKRPSA